MASTRVLSGRTEGQGDARVVKKRAGDGLAQGSHGTHGGPRGSGVAPFAVMEGSIFLDPAQERLRARSLGLDSNPGLHLDLVAWGQLFDLRLSDLICKMGIRIVR